MAEISVIVPVYRVEAYLARCVESILAQTWEDFELILVDDGSPDSCGALCDGYARQDSRVRVIHQANGGLSAARNAGIDWAFANSASQWLTFIDSDDWVHPKYLELLVKAAEDQGASISVCGYAETRGEAPAVRPEDLTPRVDTPKAFYMEHFINATIAWGKLYRKACFARVRYPVGKLHEDEFVTYRLLFDHPPVVFLPAPLYAYFVNTAGITKGGWSPRRLDAWQAYEEQIAYFEAYGDEELVRYRYRGYLENAMVNWTAAQDGGDKRVLSAMRRKIRALLRRAWRKGYLDFWIDFDILIQFFPLWTRLYRLGLELKPRGRDDANA